jgi:hypothetical protein
VLVCLHLNDVRGFLILTTAVLLVIGICVGVSSAKWEQPNAVACNSVRDCVDIARAFGIESPLLTPTNPDLRFQEGTFFPDIRPLGWNLFLMFGDSQQIEALQWRVGSRGAINYTVCLRIEKGVALEAPGGLRFCDLGGFEALFTKDQVQYDVADYSPTESPPTASRRAWLIRQLSNLRHGDSGQASAPPGACPVTHPRTARCWGIVGADVEDLRLVRGPDWQGSQGPALAQ